MDNDRWEGDAVGVSVTTFLRPAREEQRLKDLLSWLRTSAPELLPDSFQVSVVDEDNMVKVRSRKPLTEASLSEVQRKLQVPKQGFARLTKGSPLMASILLPTLADDGRPYDSVSLTVRREAARSSLGRRKFLRVARQLFEIYEGLLGDLGTVPLYKMAPENGRGARRVLGRALEHGLPAPRWGFLLGLEYVNLLGSDRLRRAPCEIVEEFADGSFLLLLAEDFEVLETNESLLEERRRRLVEHIGPEYFSYVDEGQPKIVVPRFSPSGASTDNKGTH